LMPTGHVFANLWVKLSTKKTDLMIRFFMI